MYKKFSVVLLALVMSAISIFAQNNTQVRSAVSGQKYKIKGVVVAKDDANTFVVRDTVGVDTRIVVTPNASIKNNAFFGGDKFKKTAISSPSLLRFSIFLLPWWGQLSPLSPT